MTDKPIDIVPQPRIDTLVTDAAGRQRRRSEYAGTIWFGGRPEVSAYGIVARSAPAVIDTPMFLPDSLAYRPDPLEDALVACSVAIQGSQEGAAHVLECSAGIAPDPRNPSVYWAQLRVSARVVVPFAVSYRVEVLVAMNGILAKGEGA